MDKLTRTAKALDVVFKIGFWLIALFCIGFSALSVFMLLGGDALMQSENLHMVLHCSGISLSGDALPAMDLKKTFIPLAVFFILCSAFVLYEIHVIRKILSPMKAGRPFSTGTGKCFSRLGWLTLIFGGMQETVKCITRHMLLDALSQAAAGADITYTVQSVLDGTFILAAALLFLFSFVFKYGEELQRLSDETL